MGINSPETPVMCLQLELGRESPGRGVCCREGVFTFADFSECGAGCNLHPRPCYDASPLGTRVQTDPSLLLSLQGAMEVVRLRSRGRAVLSPVGGLVDKRD